MSATEAPPSPAAPTDDGTYDTVAVALAVAEACWDVKARNVRALDVRGIVPYADFLVVCHGTSDRHAEAIAGHVVDDLRPTKVRPLGIEGVHGNATREQGAWILVDLGDVILHVFGHPDIRQQYNIESIFRDVPRLTLDAPDELEETTTPPPAGPGA